MALFRFGVAHAFGGQGRDHAHAGAKAKKGAQGRKLAPHGAFAHALAVQIRQKALHLPLTDTGRVGQREALPGERFFKLQHILAVGLYRGRGIALFQLKMGQEHLHAFRRVCLGIGVSVFCHALYPARSESV